MPMKKPISLPSSQTCWHDFLDHLSSKALPMRIKCRTRLQYHILPRWKEVRIGQMRSKEILDWLHAECTSWYMMVDLRNVMSTIFTKAQEWEVLPDTFANPAAAQGFSRGLQSPS